jgi:hypothetical protein
MLSLVRVIYDELIAPKSGKKNTDITSPLLGIRGKIASAIVNRRLVSSQARRELFNETKYIDSGQPISKYKIQHIVEVVVFILFVLFIIWL